MQRAASLRMDVEAPSSLNAQDEQDDVPQVQDMTPRFLLRCLPNCLQFIVLSFLGGIFNIIAFPLVGPMFTLMALFLVHANRQLLRDYEEKGDIVEGHVVERSPLTIKFLSIVIVSNGFCITVEYSVGDATFRKKFHISKEQYDEFTMNSTLDLLVVPGKPKSAMLKTFIEHHSPNARWKLILAGILISLFTPVFLAVVYLHDALSSWDAVRHGCVIGVISFLVACILYWWWDPAAKQKRAYWESAERVDGDADEAMPFDNQDSLTAPLLSVVTGM